MWGIGSQPEIRNAWTFKGGTCLKKCFIETWRFSEDLDFTVLPGGPMNVDALTEIFKDVLNRVHSESGIDFSVKQPVFKESQSHDYTGGSIYYRGPRKHPQPARIKLDLLGSEKLVKPPVFRQIFNPYTEYEKNGYPQAGDVLCYSFEEVFAEKIRAMGERCRPRDLYDIVNLFRNRNDIETDADTIYQVLCEKCKNKNLPVTTFHSIDASIYKQELIAEWENMLRHQLPLLPDFKSFWDDLPGLFRWLENQTPLVRLASIPRDSGEQVTTWAPPRTLGVWGAGYSLETIRFAAFNHLCVDISYLKQGHEYKQYRIEPYSLYKTQEGNTILRAVRVDNGEPRSFRIDRIRKATVTNVTFAPRFQIDMYAKGPSSSFQKPSKRNLPKTIGHIPKVQRPVSFGIKTKSTFSTGITYVYECPFCHKKFRRSSMDSKLNTHKGAYGMNCPGLMGILVKT
ncbi:MAG: nucleotidyl transferase AbiEii/AbiGii toxin family protein, partial [Proteobacteria bacterium]|nr:nucleotidyl transferase AbiEii/AbiGii toxin family protein [Pseudomonadota bacterium]